MSKLALIIPTRGRPHNIVELLKSLEETKSENTDLFLVVDDDDPERGNYLDLEQHNRAIRGVIVLPRAGKGMAKPLNAVASRLKNSYEYFAFMGDDHRPRTENWDKDFITALDELGTGLVYGNDLHQGKNLPTAVAMTGNIVRALDGMVPPNMIHLYLDNFWLKLGNDLNAIGYLDWVVIEHLHPAWGTATSDEGYKDVNDPAVYSADKIAFENYIASSDYLALLTALR